MTQQKKLPAWTRVVSAALAVGGVAAYAIEFLETGVTHWYELLAVPVGFYGIFLFAYFSMRGYLPSPFYASRSSALRNPEDEA